MDKCDYCETTENVFNPVYWVSCCEDCFYKLQEEYWESEKLEETENKA